MYTQNDPFTIYTCNGIGVTTITGNKNIEYGDTFRLAPGQIPQYAELWKIPTLETYCVTSEVFQSFFHSSTITPLVSKHQDHEVVENQVMNKAFQMEKFNYCRDCKEEV